MSRSLPFAILVIFFLFMCASGYTASFVLFQFRRSPRIGRSRCFSSSKAVSASSTSSAAAKSPPPFRIYYNDVYEVQLPPKHRFPMNKYAQVRKRVQNHLRTSTHCEFIVSPLATFEELETTHDRKYIQRFLDGKQSALEQRNVGFPWSRQGVARALSSVGGTVAAACDICHRWNAQNRKGLPPWGAHVAGGTHHAFFDYGEGFSVFSDIAVAANVVQERFPDLIKNVLIVDLDVHQGNGNAVLFQGNSNVSTFSMQCDGNYFSTKQESDLDIELPIGCTDQTYLVTLKHWLNRIEKEADGAFDLVFYQAGVDILVDDRLGRMDISKAGVRRRNQLVYEFTNRLNVPLVICMGGGYPRTDDWTPIIEAHCSVYIQASEFLVSLTSDPD